MRFGNHRIGPTVPENVLIIVNRFYISPIKFDGLQERTRKNARNEFFFEIYQMTFEIKLDLDVYAHQRSCGKVMFSVVT